jgi:ATP-dependent helicase/nuclease subunit A
MKQRFCRNVVLDGFFFGSEPVADWQLRSCQNPLEWVLYGLSDQKVLHDAFQTGLVANAQDDDLFDLKVYGQQELEQLSRFVLSLRAGKLAPRDTKDKSDRKRKSGSPPLLAQLKEFLAWRYKYGDAPILPAKQSVTELTHRSDEYVRLDYSRALERQPRALLAVEPVEGRLIGTATHAVIARVDLTQPVTAEAVTETVEKLVADGAVGSAVAEQIDIDSILAFFRSELGRMALAPENTVWREWPFTFAFPASEFASSLHASRFTSDESIVVQGIIDMLIRTPKGLVVIDFKTDKVIPEGVAERAELYREQLALYSRAAEAVLRSEILGRWLYFLTVRIPVAV